MWCGCDMPDRFTVMSFFRAPKEEHLCSSCQQLFASYKGEHCCKGCGRTSTKEYCLNCQKWQEKDGQLIICNQALFHYDAAAKEWISRYKFQGDCLLGWMLVDALKTCLKDYQDYKIVPIPSSKVSLAKRQFKAVEYPLQLAGIHYENLLQDIRTGKKQSEKTRQERLLLEQPFKILGNITDKNILLIDDVYTTGSTLHRAAELLKENNVQSVKSVTFFR